jgi:hypothetical protein
MMNQGIVLLAGSLPVDHVAFDRLVAEFGWAFKEADGIHSLSELSVNHNLAVVLFSPKHFALPWRQALRAVLDAAPLALPILCHTFAEPIDWPQAADAGAFHSLHLPFDVREVRQSLGYAWGAKRRLATISMRRRPNPRRVMREQTPHVRALPTVNVA